MYNVLLLYVHCTSTCMYTLPVHICISTIYTLYQHIYDICKLYHRFICSVVCTSTYMYTVHSTNFYTVPVHIYIYTAKYYMYTVTLHIYILGHTNYYYYTNEKRLNRFGSNAPRGRDGWLEFL